MTNPESRSPTGQKFTWHVTIGIVNAGLLVISYNGLPMEITNRPPPRSLGEVSVSVAPTDLPLGRS